METKSDLTERKADKVRYALTGKMKIARSEDSGEAVAVERQITFVASDARRDRADEIVEIGTFMLPTKSGKLVKVASLLPGNEVAVDVPLLTDHDGFSVDKVIGSVRRAEYRDGQLIFTAGISNRKYAQDLLLLLTEGHLHNAFSIGWRGGEYLSATKAYANGEIIEVSLVTRGCNRDASLLAVGEPDNEKANAPQADAKRIEIENRVEQHNRKEDYSMDDTEPNETSVSQNTGATAEPHATSVAETGGSGTDVPQGEGNETEKNGTSVPQNADDATNGTNVAEPEENETNVPEKSETAVQETDSSETSVPETGRNETSVSQHEPHATNATNVAESTINQAERKTMTTHQKIAVSQVEAPAQKTAVTSNAKAYLDTKEANHDFAKFIVENYGKSNAAVMKAWAEKMRAKGITGQEILPTTIEQTFFKVWQNESGILAHLKPSRLLQGSAYAFTTKSRAFGHKKGEQKDDASFETVRRDYKAKIAYVRMPIDLQDLIDDTTGELTLLRSELLADLLYTEIARAVVIGDGRTAVDEQFSSHDHRLFDGTRGIWAMESDITDSKTPDEKKFAGAVATEIENDASDEPFDKALKVLSALRGTGEKILVAPTGFLLGCQLDHDSNRNYKFQPGSDFAKLLNCRIFEFDWMSEAKHDLIAFNSGAYLFPTGNDMLRTAFDTEFNTDIMLLEKPVTGTLFGRRVCAGYAQAGDV